jgi:glyoxylase-like metal-dependent hydrolase (beta-lactamase superfamily II)
MISRLIALGLCFAPFSFIELQSVAWAAEPVTVAMTVQQVGAHSYYVQGAAGAASAENQGFMSNAGFVVTSQGVIVFDALGTPPLGAALIAKIREITSQPIVRVIVSHYHADHIYGLQAFKGTGAEIWAHRAALEYLQSNLAQTRLAERRQTLFPWVDEQTKLVAADRWLDEDTRFELGGLHFHLTHVGPAHSPEDLMMEVEEDHVVYAGDLIFAGRVPFVGDADSRLWIAAIDRMLASGPGVIVTGHGPASRDPAADLALTRDYLLYLRQTMGAAVDDFVPFDEAYARTDWSRYERLPAFADANRINAYGTYLSMEREALEKK